MQGRNSGRARARSGALAVCALAGLFAVPACSKKITTVDPGFVPEGTPSPSARLLIWPDESNPMPFYRDIAPADPDPGDEFLGVEEFRRSVPGANHGIILDHTDASDYQVFRTESNGGMTRFRTSTSRARGRGSRRSGSRTTSSTRRRPASRRRPTWDGVCGAASPRRRARSRTLRSSATVRSRTSR